MQKEWFEDWFDSPYYHLLYKHRNEAEALAFVVRCGELLEVKPHQKLLDIACGKGRHAVAFAALGLDVTGVDLSEESIYFAKRSEHEHLHFFVHDMRTRFCTDCFDHVTNLFTSFGYFESENDNRLAADGIAAALHPGGKFLIDFMNKAHAILNIEQNKCERTEKAGVTFDIQRSICGNKLLKEITVRDRDEVHHFRESVNSFTLAEMTELFESVGLRLIQSFGDYELKGYDEQNSPRMILLFEKPVA